MNNKGFLLVETIVVSTFVLTTLLLVYSQFSNLVNIYNTSYKYNTVEGIYNLNNVKKYLSYDSTDSLSKSLDGYSEKILYSGTCPVEISADSQLYLILYDGTCNTTNLSAYTDVDTDLAECNQLFGDLELDLLLYTSANLTSLQSHLKTTDDDNISQSLKEFILALDSNDEYSHRIIAAFNDETFASISLDHKDEVDSKVFTDDLLFWAQADNEENTLTTLKDKSGNGNDGTLYNFNNTSSSGYTDEGLVFDGVDDFVDIGFTGYDFQNSVSMVMYVEVLSFYVINTEDLLADFYGNYEKSGFGFYNVVEGDSYPYLGFEVYDGTEYRHANDCIEVVKNTFYALAGTYDGSRVIYYRDGESIGAVDADQLTVSPLPILIGANPHSSYLTTHKVDYNMTANIVVKEAMLYDRALTEDEVKSITKGFWDKYN